MKRIFLYILVALAMVGCSSKENYILFNKTKISSPDANKSITRLHNVRYEYRIQPHDRVSITMYNHPELGTSSVQSQKQDTRGVLVDSRGFVRLPLVKKVHIAGLTQTSAQEKIERAYKAYLEDAEVSLEVLNKRAYILGEVKKPGEVELFNEKLTLIQLLAKAGGFTDYANRQAIVILEHRNKKIKTQTIDLTGINSIKMANLVIYPNDVVYVAPNDMKPFNSKVSQYSPIFGLASSVLNPIVNLKYLSNN